MGSLTWKTWFWTAWPRMGPTNFCLYLLPSASKAGPAPPAGPSPSVKTQGSDPENSKIYRRDASAGPKNYIFRVRPLAFQLFSVAAGEQADSRCRFFHGLSDPYGLLDSQGRELLPKHRERAAAVRAGHHAVR